MPGRTKRISVDGVEYPSIRAAAEALNLPEGRFRDRIRNGWTPEQAAGITPPLTFAHKERHLEIDGKVYASVPELTNKFGVPGNRIRQRLDKHKWTLRQAVELDPPPEKRGRKHPIEFRGKTYRNAAELTRAFDADHRNFGSRRRAGWSIEQALGLEAPPSKRSWRVNAEVIEGRAYPKGESGQFLLYLITCVPTGKEYVGVTTGSLEKRWGEHVSNSKTNSDSKVKLYRAIRKYGTDNFKIELLRDDASNYSELLKQEFKEVARRDTYKNGLNSTPGGETTGDPRSIKVQGQTFPTLTSAAEFFGVDESVIRSRLDVLGWTIEQAVGIAPRPTDWGPKAVELQGVMYPSLKDAAKAYGLAYSKVHLRMSRYNWTLEQAFELEDIERPPGIPQKIEFRGKSYNSRGALARDYDMDEMKLYGRLQKGWTIEQALGVEDRPRPRAHNAIAVTYKGKTYGTLKELAVDLGVSYKLLSARLKKSWTLDEAIRTPPGQKRQGSN